jgi:hypothetical protein
MTAVEGGIEAGNLQDMWLSLQNSPDWRKIVRLMQRRERLETSETIDDSFIDDRRRTVVWTSVNDTVPDDDRKRPADLLPQEAYQLLQRCRHGIHLGRRPRLVDKQLTLGILRNQVGVRAYSLYLSLEAAFEPVALADLEQLELDARAAGVHD